MSLIKKVSEINVQTKIKALIYGQAGTGKTTLAVSSPKPLLIDFDGGVHRVNFNHLANVGIVQVTSYEDFLDVLNENLDAFETIVIDTGGKMLDYTADYLIKKNPKLGKANGTLTLQGYGERKGEFSAINRKIAVMGKHIIYIAHRETQTDGDDKRYVPLFGGSNYDSLVTELDLVGYLEANGRKRVITFDPTSRNDGKNTCNLPSQIELPVIVDEKGNISGSNTFITEKVIKPYQQRLEQRKAATSEYEKVIDEIREQVLLVTDALSANNLIKRIDTFKHVGSSKMMAATMLAQHAKKLGITFNKERKVYEEAERVAI